MDYIIFQQLGIAILLGGLIGLEREKNDGSRKGFAGIRTFTLMALFGALIKILFGDNALIFAIFTAAYLLLVLAAYVITASQKRGSGVTTEIAAILVYMVGVMVAMKLYVLATAVTIALLIVLHFKGKIHLIAGQVKNKEIVSLIQFVIIAFVVLPLLPNKGFGPYEVLNPYVIWLMVVLISGISFASYVAVRVFGEKRGIGITGFLAGLVSSTALTLSFSEQSKKNKSVVNPYVFAVVLASSAMFFRILLEVLVINKKLVSSVALPIVLMGVTGLCCAYYFWRWAKAVKEASKEVKEKAMQVQNPFDIVPALEFALFFAIVLFLSKMASELWGNHGIYATSVLSAILDVNAITVSLANLAHNGLEEAIATRAIILAALVNTMVKAAIFMIFGNRVVARKIIICLLLVAFVGIGSTAMLELL